MGLARLFTVPLAAAGELDPAHAYLVRISVSQVRPSTDNDPYIGITDGTNFIGFEKEDGSNTVEGECLLGTFSNGGNTLVVGTHNESGDSGTNEATFDILIHLDPAAGSATNTLVSYRRDNYDDGFEYSSPIDLTKPISFITFGDSSDETYGFYSFEVTVRRDD